MEQNSNDLGSVKVIKPNWSISARVLWGIAWRGTAMGVAAFFLVALVFGLIAMGIGQDPGVLGASAGVVPFLLSYVVSTKMILDKKRFQGFQLLLIERQNDS